MDAAIQNLDFLRRLIEEARQENTYDDMLKLRMLLTGMQEARQEEA